MILNDVSYKELLENISNLIPSVQLDICFSFDEKFVFWAINNDFDKYLK